MNKNDILKRFKEEDIKKIFSDLGIKHIYLVGSFSRDENNNLSDIDIVYEKDKTKRIGGLFFINKKNILEEKLARKIDLVNIDYIYSDIRNEIEKDKILIF